MSDGRLSHDEFLQQLTDLFESRKGKDHGKIFLTQKRLTPQNETSALKDNPLADLDPPAQPFSILIRASDGRGSATSPSNAAYDSKVKMSNAPKRGQKIKISTIVEPGDLESFFTRYAECCKTGMGAGLKKRDRRKRTKGKGGGKG